MKARPAKSARPNKIVRIVYFDEAGIALEAQEPITVVAAVIVHTDSQWHPLSRACERLIERTVPKRYRSNFEFHAKDLFSGCKKFRGWKKEERWEVLRRFLGIIRGHGLPIVWGAVDRQSLAEWLKPHEIESFGMSVQDVAFLRCAAALETWFREHAPNEMAMCIADEARTHKTMKAILRDSQQTPLKKGFPDRFDHLADTIYFGSSHKSIGLQMSDHCNFFIKRHLMQRDNSERFYKLLNPFIVPSFVFDPSRPVED